MKTDHVVVSFLGIGIPDYRANFVFAYLKPVARLEMRGIMAFPAIFFVCPDNPGGQAESQVFDRKKSYRGHQGMMSVVGKDRFETKPDTKSLEELGTVQTLQ